MPLLVYSVSDFVAFTKIRSADVNARFTDIKTLLNTTGLDDSNLQNAGITRATKLKAGTAYALVANSVSGAMGEIAVGTAGQFLGSNGTNWLAVASPLTSQFPAIVGTAAQVTAGTATHSTFASAQAAINDGDAVLLLNITLTENLSVSKRLYIQGLGSGSVVSGTITLASGSSSSVLRNLRVTDNVTINSGVDKIEADIILASGKTFIDNSLSSSTNALKAMQE